jgi:hypothetical protein
VGKYNSGELFRVNVADPKKVDRVALPKALTRLAPGEPQFWPCREA